jgi:hypothetical protein
MLCPMIAEETCFRYDKHQMRFQVLMAANLKMTVSWDIAPCSLVEIDRRFRADRPDEGGSKHL